MEMGRTTVGDSRTKLSRLLDLTEDMFHSPVRPVWSTGLISTHSAVLILQAHRNKEEPHQETDPPASGPSHAG